ncbi:6-phosphogluconolactonase [Schleiferiaceae bacterium]|nr:6-phosphogluconolactonase [Schleiferiaceae bacterium]
MEIVNMCFASSKDFNIYFVHLIRKEILNRTANLIVSGGRSIKPFIRYLQDVEWPNGFSATLFLSDEYIEKDLVLNSNAAELDILTGNSNFDIKFKFEGKHYSEAVRKYDAELAKVEWFDYAVLGVGSDGHISSLFENNFVQDSESIYSAFSIHNSPKAPRKRLTITYNTLAKCKKIVLLYVGKEKSEVFKSGKLFFIEHLVKLNPELIVYRCFIELV